MAEPDDVVADATAVEAEVVAALGCGIAIPFCKGCLLSMGSLVFLLSTGPCAML